jgi:hypothetical protein
MVPGIALREMAHIVRRARHAVSFAPHGMKESRIAAFLKAGMFSKMDTK